MHNGYYIDDKKVIVDYSSFYCETHEKLLRSELFFVVLSRYVKHLHQKESPVLEKINQYLNVTSPEESAERMRVLLRLLNSYTCTEIVEINPSYAGIKKVRDFLIDFIEGLYDFWRKYERYLLLSGPETRLRTRESIHYATFIKSNDTLKLLILSTYRTLVENLIEKNPYRIYRQLPSGGQVGLFTQHIKWDIPDGYEGLKSIPFIRLTVLDPPVIFYPEQNKREGLFKEVHQNPVEGVQLHPDEWFCYPARIGKLLAFAYFHRSFLSLGTSLVNLFEIAQFEDIYKKRPDIILVFGAPPSAVSDDITMFYQDDENGVLVGYEVNDPKIDYFGYVKKMLLTLHNISKINRNALPIHGAMVSVRLKNKKKANVIIVGDSGAGKSETLEAFRILASEYLNEMTIIFDDMGSLVMDNDGNLLAYGTEIGAFLRLDDLQPGFAYEQIDRSIFMNPHLTNARLIVPVTSFNKVVRGTPVDYILYANNYEPINDQHPVLEFFTNPEAALDVFRAGRRKAKGTTTEKGLVESYFANPFGGPQRRNEHEKIAVQYFNYFFDHGIKVGQIRTQLGIEGMEMKGPQIAAEHLFEEIGSVR
ncbi:MAG: phosphoenolpyruvate carboxykinase [Calditrichia bacterium]